MKKSKINLIGAVFLLLLFGYIHGVYNYQSAIKDANRTDMTDNDISNSNISHGFNLDWHEVPGVLDYLYSGLTSFNNNNLITI